MISTTGPNLPNESRSSSSLQVLGDKFPTNTRCESGNSVALVVSSASVVEVVTHRCVHASLVILGGEENACTQDARGQGPRSPTVGSDATAANAAAARGRFERHLIVVVIIGLLASNEMADAAGTDDGWTARRNRGD